MKYRYTSEIKPLSGILGQNKATYAMEFGLMIDDPGYNIYMSGETGTGRTSYALDILNEYAKNKNLHKDICYVYNFENPIEPIYLYFDIGIGKLFKKDMEKVIECLLDELKKAFDSEEYEKGKNQILDEYELKRETLIQKMKEYGEERNFNLKISKVGMVFAPKDENVDKRSQEYLKAKREIEDLTIEVVAKVKELENKAKKDILDLEESIGKFIINPHFNTIIYKYGKTEKHKNYFKRLRKIY